MVATDAEPIIRVEHLSASFGPNVIFDDVSFEVMPGEVFMAARISTRHPCCKRLPLP